ncbi:ATP-binding protein [Mariprofundus ferrooxydans]|uniref:ATP-binding protein n=1 Tax=Mariprofundus ferrooxydans TaxID=314344 RepID=UPI0014303461|nr:ATP-binding protein [Mariprofundus ferrooxydans]
MKSISSQFRIPEIAGADASPAAKIQCVYHGWQYGEQCEMCELERERAERSMFAKCESMGLAPRYHCIRFDDYRTELPGQAKAVEAARKFIAGDYHVLVLRGSDRSEGYGTGKTMLSAIILYERLIESGSAGIYSTADRLIAELKDSIEAKSGETQRIKDRYIKVGLLVIDELLADPMSGWAGKQISDIIAERIDYGRQTIIASNRDAKKIAGALHPRTMDRLQACSVGVVFDWPSERGAA